ncbi:hypothetical protein [Methylocella tundrae]|uniref:Uncharacterized protein n=1 Tax=Methylocella tundrae TaxID=227605 RepID=A0A4U8YVU7_METTU|nr:hypothetical protein [Methylocella tundrae]WPP05524.1 hypothetical protein SIN04_06780 [Methylocella tundrae]VFU07951.1 conserved protein of unknown function [Methylocella tundrae]
MKIDFSKSILGIDGAPLLDETKQELRLSVLSINSLLSPKTPLSGEQNVKRFQLALRLNDASEVEITPEEAALIKTCATETFASPLIVGRMFEALNG